MTSADRDRLEDLHGDDTRLLPERETGPASGASRNRPTCRPTASATTAHTPSPHTGLTAFPAQPSAPAIETKPIATERRESHTPQATHSTAGLPSELIELQQAADDAHLRLQQLHDHHERDLQRQVWRDAAEAVQAAVTHYARTKRLNRYEVEACLRHLVRHPTP
ncbi:hypothetical protein [Streptomyces caelestis]|uniref:hypothetical protein n=1 Tax=Streptomyces caelestis TaxID=36816 RepID=UPI0036653535